MLPNNNEQNRRYNLFFNALFHNAMEAHFQKLLELYTLVNYDNCDPGNGCFKCMGMVDPVLCNQTATYIIQDNNPYGEYFELELWSPQWVPPELAERIEMLTMQTVEEAKISATPASIHALKFDHALTILKILKGEM